MNHALTTRRRHLLRQADHLERRGRLAEAIQCSRSALLIEPSGPDAFEVLPLLHRRLSRFGDLGASHDMARRHNLYITDTSGKFNRAHFDARYNLALSHEKIGAYRNAREILLALLADPVVVGLRRLSVVLSMLRAALANDDRELATHAFKLHTAEFRNHAEFVAYGMLHQAVGQGQAFWETHAWQESILVFNLRAELGAAAFEAMNASLITEMESSDDWAANYAAPGTISRRTSVSGLLAAKTPALTRFRRLLIEKAGAYLVGGSAYLKPIARDGARLELSRFLGLKVSTLAEEPSHLHGGNVLSGVYYPYVPASVNDRGSGGHIEFGRPDIRFNGPTPPTREIQPETGLLLLFPAYLFHRILPGAFGEERFSIAFDFTFAH